MKKYLIWILLILLVVVLALSWFFYFRHLPVFQKKPDQTISIPVSGKLTAIEINAQEIAVSTYGKTNGKLCFKIQNVKFTLADIFKEENKLKRPGFEETMKKITEQDQQKYRTQIRTEAIKNIAYRVYVDLYIKDNKILVSEAKVDEVMKEYEQVMRQNSQDASFVLEKYLESVGVTMAEFRLDMTYQAKFAVVMEPLAQTVPISSEEEIAAYYEKNKEIFNEPPAADINIMLTDSEAKVDEAIVSLNNGNAWDNTCAKFSTLSADQSKLGLMYKDRLPEEMAKVVFDPASKLKTPYKVQYMSQWYVVMINSIQAGVTHTFEEIKGNVEEQLSMEKKNAAQAKFMNELADKYGKIGSC